MRLITKIINRNSYRSQKINEIIIQTIFHQHKIKSSTNPDDPIILHSEQTFTIIIVKKDDLIK